MLLCAHFVEEETEGQRGEVTCLRSYGQQVAGPDLDSVHLSPASMDMAPASCISWVCACVWREHLHWRLTEVRVLNRIYWERLWASLHRSTWASSRRASPQGRRLLYTEGFSWAWRFRGKVVTQPNRGTRTHPMCCPGISPGHLPASPRAHMSLLPFGLGRGNTSWNSEVGGGSEGWMSTIPPFSGHSATCQAVPGQPGPADMPMATAARQQAIQDGGEEVEGRQEGLKVGSAWG